MSFIIVKVLTGRKYTKPGQYSNAYYDTERGANAACTRLNKKDPGHLVMPVSEYATVYPTKMVTRVNKMTGAEYQEAEDTPLCCSPSSETFWSM